MRRSLGGEVKREKKERGVCNGGMRWKREREGEAAK
jgi:hypothetical protein